MIFRADDRYSEIQANVHRATTERICAMGLIVVQPGHHYGNIVEYLVNDLGASKIQLPGLKSLLQENLHLYFAPRQTA